MVDLSFKFFWYWIDFRFLDELLRCLRPYMSLSMRLGYFLGVLGQNELEIEFLGKKT